MRFELKKHTDPNYWLCIDKKNGLICEFENENFNENQSFDFKKGMELTADMVVQLPTWLSEMSDWLRENHYEKVFKVKQNKIESDPKQYLHYVWGENNISQEQPQTYIIKLDHPACSIRFNYEDGMFTSFEDFYNNIADVYLYK